MELLQQVLKFVRTTNQAIPKHPNNFTGRSSTHTPSNPTHLPHSNMDMTPKKYKSDGVRQEEAPLRLQASTARVLQYSRGTRAEGGRQRGDTGEVESQRPAEAQRPNGEDRASSQVYNPFEESPSQLQRHIVTPGVFRRKVKVGAYTGLGPPSMLISCPISDSEYRLLVDRAHGRDSSG